MGTPFFIYEHLPLARLRAFSGRWLYLAMAADGLQQITDHFLRKSTKFQLRNCGTTRNIKFKRKITT